MAPFKSPSYLLAIEQEIYSSLVKMADSNDVIGLVADGKLSAQELNPESYNLPVWVQQVSSYLQENDMTLSEFISKDEALFWDMGRASYDPPEE